MLEGNPDLNDLLERARIDPRVQPFIADIFTITDTYGNVISRWTDADIDIPWDGNTYIRGPGIAAGQLTKQTGTQASRFDLTLYMSDLVTLNGKPLSDFVLGGGFFLSTLQHEEAYAEDDDSPILGTLPQFKGVLRGMQTAGETQATLIAYDARSLLNRQVPVNNFMPPCSHMVFDSGCKLDRELFKVLGSVQGEDDPRTLSTSITAPATYLDLGEIVFLTGANTNVRRAVKTQNADGTIAMLLALPESAQPGDTFVGYPGCDLTTAMCAGKFGNIAHFDGNPFTPVNEMAAP